ncbi:siderophore ferric iron reductase [Marinobacterium sp. AK62]|uniref:Siderophore ferric iron reductase n=1 Tax=Marinobacterium alkalitolerans TaxID=1542925 RepID=A0ABS3ZAN9_9GAMM|nr:siderophore ferric iron reductase [Marinobacterium alkalitolerans]MBP0048761.1 siderophore ferric iron reductase [Marinobacterium alkalitolerans]
MTQTLGIEQSEDSSAQKLAELCWKLLPALPVDQGSLSAPNVMVLTRAQDGQLEALVSALAKHHPEAGRHYWSVRAWNLLMWQPVLVTLLATEVMSRPVDLLQLGQKCQDTVVAGMVLGDEILPSGVLSRSEMGAYLREVSEVTLTDLGRVIRINSALARRLLADRVLSTLLRIRPLLAEASNTRAHSLAEHWLRAAGLKSASALMEFELPDRSPALALDRKGCCQHFRRQDGGLCKTCPRQSKTTRIKRLQEEWHPDAGAE